jgi:hypothetical protein
MLPALGGHDAWPYIWSEVAEIHPAIPLGGPNPVPVGHHEAKIVGGTQAPGGMSAPSAGDTPVFIPTGRTELTWTH